MGNKLKQTISQCIVAINFKAILITHLSAVSISRQQNLFLQHEDFNAA